MFFINIAYNKQNKKMVNAIPSNGVLNQLYSSLCSTGAQSAIINFFNTPNSPNYVAMGAAIVIWAASDAAKASIGLTPSDTIVGLRVQVIEADGKTVFDLASTINNTYANIGIPAADFLTTGKYLINENQNTRSYIMSAALSQTGIAYQTKYSNSVGTDQIYIAVRQGSTSEPLATIVVSMLA